MRERMQQSFGQQAARFSLYVPLAVLAIGCLGWGGRGEAGVRTALAGVNAVLIVAGFALGLVALVSMRRYGRQGILWRALVGVAVNGALLAVVVTAFEAARRTADLRDRLVGTWQLESGPPSAISRVEMAFGKDMAFRMKGQAPDGSAVELRGRWGLAREAAIGVTIDTVVSGNPAAAGTQLGLGRVRTLDPDRLVMQTDRGDEVFRRVR